MAFAGRASYWVRFPSVRCKHTSPSIDCLVALPTTQEQYDMSSKRAASLSPDEVQLLLKAACCVMAADGRLVEKELDSLLVALKRLNIPHDPHKTRDHVIAACKRIYKHGVRSCADEVASQISAASSDLRSLVLAITSQLQVADGTASAAEITVTDALNNCRAGHSKASPAPDDNPCIPTTRLGQQASLASTAHSPVIAAATAESQPSAQSWDAIIASWAVGANATMSTYPTRSLLAVSLCLLGGVFLFNTAHYVLEWRRNQTPVALFERFAQGNMRSVQIHCPLLPVSKIKYDVRTTDSLMSPYVGILTFSTKQRVRHKANGKAFIIEGDVECEVISGKPEGSEWRFVSATLKPANWHVIETDESGIAGEVADRMNREGVAPEVFESKWATLLNRLIDLENTGFPLEQLTTLETDVAWRLGDSARSNFVFERLEHIEDFAISTLVSGRKAFLKQSGGLDDGLSDWREYLQNESGDVAFGNLVLNMSDISDQVAEEIAAFRGTVSLGVSSLSDRAAGHLASHRGPLQLRRLRQISPPAAVMLARHADDLEMGVNELADEAFVCLALDNSPKERLHPKSRKVVSLPRLTYISEGSIKAILDSPVCFRMNGLKTLTSAALCKKLLADGTDSFHIGKAQFEYDGFWMRQLQTVSDEVAEELARYAGDVSLSELQALTSVRLANKLAGQANTYLSLPCLRQLSPAVATALAEYSGELRIADSLYDEGGLRDLSDDVAEALARHRGGLQIGVRSLQPHAAKALAVHEGELCIHVPEEVPEQVREVLRAHAGTVVIHCRETRKDYRGGDGSPLKAE